MLIAFINNLFHRPIFGNAVNSSLLAIGRCLIFNYLNFIKLFILIVNFLS